MTVLELSRWQFGITAVYLDGLDQVDEIVVLDHGRVAERGTHTELVQSGGAYQRLWEAFQ